MASSFSSFFYHLVCLHVEAAEQVMDLPGLNHQGILSQNENLQESAQDTDSPVARTTILDHKISNRFYPNMLSGCADESILTAPETTFANVFGASSHAHQFYQSTTESLQVQPQDDNHLSEMYFVFSTTGGIPRNHWPWSAKESQGDFLSGFYADNVNPDGPSEALNCQDRDTSYHGSLLPYD